MAPAFHRIGHGLHPVLVLNGWFGDARSFDAMEPWLATDEFSYVFMDYRGYGKRKDEAGQYTIDEIAGDAVALADALSLARFSLIGHSMGGMVIEKIAIRAPGRVRSLLPIAPVPCGGMRYDVATRAYLEAAVHSAAHRRSIIDRSTGGCLPATWLDWKTEYSLATSSPTAFSGYFNAWADTDFSSQIEGVHPLNVIIGERDPVFNADLMAKTYLKRYPGSSLSVMPDVGHYPMNEAPLALVSLIESFLRTV